MGGKHATTEATNIPIPKPHVVQVLLKHVGEWSMPNVMQRPRQHQQVHVARLHVSLVAIVVEHARSPLECHVGDAHRVLEARMLGARIDKVGAAKLLQVPQALKVGRVDKTHDGAWEMQAGMDGVLLCGGVQFVDVGCMCIR